MPLVGQSPPKTACAPLSPTLNESLDRAWEAYRANNMTEAQAAFQQVLSACPKVVSAANGLGYVALRHGDLPSSERYFERALSLRPNDYDAITGLGMASYRAGDQVRSRMTFERALKLFPQDSVTKWYLARLPASLDTTRLAPVSRPVTTQVAARVAQRAFEVPNGRGGWQPMWLKGLNIGAALPGKHPSEFPPDDGTYEHWLALTAEMGVNTLRVYTVHPPHFYRALAQWNATHPTQTLWLIHGVWTELPPGPQEEQYDDPSWLAEFHGEMHNVVNLLHGHAVIPARPGHAFGVYRADVSRWVVAYIIGREWEPHSIVGYQANRPDRTKYEGKYLTVARGNAAEAWLAEQCDYLIDYEMRGYNAQHPIAYTNWPTLDPLHHPTESTLAEEAQLRRARGEETPEAAREFDNDAIGLDATRMVPTPAFKAGTFASYHAYPYYPDFMGLDPDYARASGPEGQSNYFGYLRDLVRYHGDMPVVIAEYGVPSSRGIAHFQPQGWNHGGHSEVEQGAVDARLTREIHAAGAAGGLLFALMDEWFKKNWIVIDFEQPLERNRLWLNPLDAEQNYGVIAMRAGPRDSALVIDGRGEDWGTRGTWYRGSLSATLPPPLQIKEFRVANDEAYVYLRLDVGAIDWTKARYLIGIDTYRADLGDFVLPRTGATSPVGLEFVLDLTGPVGSHLLVDHPYTLYHPAPIAGSNPPTQMLVYHRPFRTVANRDGVWDTLWVETNRRRIGRDGTVFPATVYDRNLLRFARQGENSLADWYADSATGIIEVRLPWGMLHVLDPSSRSVLYGSQATTHDPEGTATEGFRFVVQSYDPGNPTQPADWLPKQPGGVGFGPVPVWAWPVWEEPRWHQEVKPVFRAMQETFRAIKGPARIVNER